MSLRKHSFNIYILLIISLFFDAYALFYIQTFPVTLFTIFSVIYIVTGLLKNKFMVIKITRQNIVLFLLIVILFINYIFYGLKHTTSFLQALYFMILCLLAYREELQDNFNNYCFLYQKLMTYMAVYGIYQFIGRLVGFPFTDLIVSNYMVEGYNWTNSTYIFGQNVLRSNAIFREPSYFGQMLAISLLLYMPSIVSKEQRDKKIIIPIILQSIAMITTISGTSIFLFAIAFSLYCVVMYKNKKIWKRLLLLVGLGASFLGYILFFTQFGSYFLNRINELFVYNRDASSGFVRFRSWIFVVEESWKVNLFFGSGIGSGAEYVAEYARKFYGMTLNGFAKVATELGLIGIFFWCMHILLFLRKKRNATISNNYLILACAMIPLIFMQEAFSSNIFWLFMMLLNCKLKTVEKGEYEDYE